MGIPSNYDFSDVVPFNSSSHYHSCTGCPANVPGQACWISNFQNRSETQLCRLDGLPDLDQSSPFVSDYLQSWVSNLIKSYSIDGLRIDTVPEVGTDFWGQFQTAANDAGAAAGGTYAMGEVFDGNVAFVASFQSKDKILDATLSYPLFFALQSAFGLERGSLVALGQLADAYAAAFEDPDALGTFVENHDNPRFLSACPDVQLYRSATLYAFFSRGIPIGYYGGEQLFAGADTEANREPLWLSGFDQTGDQFRWLSLVLAYRSFAALWTNALVPQILDDSVIAFSRGTSFVALTNSNASTVTRAVSGSQSPFAAGARICNLFWPTQDCLTVGAKGQWTLVLNDGEQKIFDLKSNIHAFVQLQQQRQWPKRLVPKAAEKAAERTPLFGSDQQGLPTRIALE